MKKTPLYDVHVALGAKMVPFAGFEMPVSYPTGISSEHRAVREDVGVFDVSHMGEFEITGSDRNAFVQRVTCNDVGALKPGQAPLAGILTSEGTFVDDCLVYRFEDKLMMVVNASNIQKDWDHILNQKAGADVRLRDISDETALLAVQGPKAEALVGQLTSLGVGMIPYYHFAQGKVAGVQCFVSRTGYTGEDGFELYCRAADAEKPWHALGGAGRPGPPRHAAARGRAAPLRQRHRRHYDAARGGPQLHREARQGRAVHGPRRPEEAEARRREAPPGGLQGDRAQGRRAARVSRLSRRQSGGHRAQRHGDADRQCRDRHDVSTQRPRAARNENPDRNSG